MTEKERISALYQSVYNGNPWIDINIIDTLKSFTAKEAFTKSKPNVNSVWEIVNHMIQWRFNVVQRIQGKILTSPENNYFTPIIDNSEQAWKSILQDLDESQNLWITVLKNFDEAQFEKVYPNNNHSYYEHIQGIIQHDLYHLGQIVILKKLV